MVRSALLVAAALRAVAKDDTGSLLQVTHLVEMEELQASEQELEASQQVLPSFMKCLAGCLPSSSGPSGAIPSSDVEWFENEQMHQKLPLPSEDLQYPPQLEGIIWMDQAGFLGHSDVPAEVAAPDGCFSFGDTQFSTLQSNADNTMSTINVDVGGPAWQWFNNGKGYLFYQTLSSLGFHYHFQFTDNYNHAQIYGTVQPPMIPGFAPPPGFLNFTMDYQSDYLDDNLCPRTATQEMMMCVAQTSKAMKGEGEISESCARVRREIAKCAKWKRVSSVLGGAPTQYFAYEIVDRNGNKRQPYFDIAMMWINAHAKPDSVIATALGMNDIAESQREGTSFRGIRGAAPTDHSGDILAQCSKCLNPDMLSMVTTANGIGIDYVMGMLSLVNKDYTVSWCDGKIEGCARKDNFPGRLVTSIMGYEAVKNMTALTPEKEWTGEWWRGGELGYIINNPFFWKANGISPPAIGLGHTPKQHAAIRPHVDKAFMLEKWTRKDRNEAFRTVDQMISDFLETRRAHPEESERKISVKTDLTILVHQILNKVSLKRDVTWDYAASFVALQGKVVGLGTISQIIPSALYQNCDPMNFACVKVRDYLEGIQKGVAEYVDEYERVLKDLGLEAELKPLDADCAPSDSCMRQMASATWDALYAAGGLSVPTQMAVGLGVLFSEHESNPFKDNKETFNSEENAMEFALELVRFFPPVVGFPHWEVRPTCEGMTAEETAKLAGPDGATKACPWDKEGKNGKPNTVNQYQGGRRIVPNLALAQRDPAVWGADSETFRIRPHQEYAKSVGFAEPAYRPDLMNGALSRNCPGKTLALHIVASFFKQLKLGQWYVDGEGPKITSGPGFVEAFELKHSSWKGANYDDAKVWIPTPDFSGKVAMEREFVPTYPQESFASVPMAKNGITIETINYVDYVVIPTDEQFKDILAVRSTNVEGTPTREFGDQRWMLDFQDPVHSPIPGAVAAFIEKVFVYDHDGPWHPTVEAKPADWPQQEPPEVTDNAVERAAKVLQYLQGSNIDSIRLAAAFDPLALADVMNYVDYRSPRASPTDRVKVSAMKERLNEGLKKVSGMPKGTQPQSAITSCIHFLRHEALILDEANKVVKFPLGRNFPAFRGQSIFSPSRHISMSVGHGFFSVDGDYLTWYHGGVNYASWELERSGYGTPSARDTYRVPPKLYVSGAGGAGMPSPAQAMDLRASSHNPADHGGRLANFQDDVVDENDHRHQLFLKFAKLPMSYAFLYSNAEATCAPHLQHIASKVQHSDYRLLAQEGMNAEEGEALNAGILEGLVCGQSLLRGAADYSNGVDSVEMFVYEHFIMEWPAERRFHAIRGDRHLYDGWFWNHKEVFDGAHPLLNTDGNTPC